MVLYFACSLYTLGIGSLVGLVIGDYVAERVVIEQNIGALPGCQARSLDSTTIGFWIVPLVVECVFFILVLWRAVAWSRENICVPAALVLMARDSAVYFACVFILLFVSILVFEFGPLYLAGLFVTPVNTVCCIAGSRMLLNLRQLGVQPDVTSEFEMVKIRQISFFRSQGDISTKGVIFNHNLNNFPGETFVNDA